MYSAPFDTCLSSYGHWAAKKRTHTQTNKKESTLGFEDTKIIMAYGQILGHIMANA